MPRLFCFGLGYSARALISRLQEDDTGWTFAGTCRSGEAHQDLIDKGVDVHLFSAQSAIVHPVEVMAGVTHILSSVPPDAQGDPVTRAHGADLPDVRWTGYLSTTGVYGDTGGAWVDETSVRKASTERGQRRIDAEDAWQSISGRSLHIFRLAGIYGPGRNQIETIRKGKARRIIKPGQVFSRIHVDDIAQVLAASIARPNPGAAYNVCDDLAAPPQDVLTFAADLAGLPEPEAIDFDNADLSPMARSFYADNKRVRNDRIRHELGVKLLYPSYKEGLTALL